MTDYRASADEWARKYGVSPELFARLVNQESGWNPNARSPVGARGLTQVMPATARSPGFGVAPLTNFDDPDEQLRFGAEYLSAMMKRYNGDEAKALAAYNAGPGVADDWNGGDTSSLPEETQGYVANIMGSGSAGVGYGPSASGVMAMPQSGGAAPQPYEPDMFDKLYGKVQDTGIGKALGLREDGFRKDSAGRNILSGILTGLGSIG